MTQNLLAFLNFTAPKRFLVLVALVCFLVAQVFAGWHGAQHDVHEKIHCSVCAAVSQIDHIVPVVAVKAKLPSHVAMIVYEVVPYATGHVAVSSAYEAQGPPSA